MSGSVPVEHPSRLLQHALWHLRFDSTRISERFVHLEDKWKSQSGFSGTLSGGSGAKIYVFSDGWPFYVGMTTRRVAERFRTGWKASLTNRVNGYSGYAFKSALSNSHLHIFTSNAGRPPQTDKDAKCIEAEVVYRIRKEGAWPRFQAEIHFSRPEAWHEAAAEEIMETFLSLRKSPLELPAN